MQVFLLLTVAYAVLAAWAPRFWAIGLPQIAIFAALAIFTATRPLRFPLFACAPAVLAAMGAVQWLTGTTQLRYRTGNAALDWATYASFALLAAQACIHRDQILRWWAYFAGALATVCILTALTSPFHIFWSVPVPFEQVFGPFVYRNHLAAFAELSLPLALTLAAKDRDKRALFAFIGALLVGAVVAAQSRTGLILVSLELIGFLALASHKRLLAPRVTILIVVTILTGAVATGLTGITARFSEEHPYRVRLEILESTLDMVRSRPLTGWGLGNFRAIYPRFARIDPGVLVNEAHNDWAQWAAEAGVPAALCMLAFAVWCARAGFRTGWALGITAVFCHALVDYPFEEPSVVLLLMLLAGLAASDAEPAEIQKSHPRSARRHIRPKAPESLPV